ncbi:glycoside hydrolase/deacetylase [Basidiobolus meristosporus CBS 931.73]|uniref:Glycoside hydrolase/deacetylase n=1 Tax=Basidiobolus meristosporus CBS 931.73 TaxID=1314790 RepID=A0A1Y1YYA7_9FUNG|nr:glycoside hydrolase/deacetylase [Basidiobolus meristosporus CBS 931.73]|eukprot:ORY03010.1 glycoside hydrolase/deacetylase [Basidiobolus meristosporus CBS 931.73]
MFILLLWSISSVLGNQTHPPQSTSLPTLPSGSLPIGVLAPLNPVAIKQIDFSQVPNIPVKVPGAGTCPGVCQPDGCENCWESCGVCKRQTDIWSCPIPNNLGLTFDDGPGSDTPKLLDILAAEGVKATFCVIGVLLQSPTHAETMRRIYKEGHTICSHTWSHPHLMSLTNEQIVSELKATEDIIVKTIGVKPRYLRPPFGEVDDRVRAIAEAMGYKILMWNLDTLDWKFWQTNASAIGDSVQQNLAALSNPTRSWVTLMHDIYSASVSQVPAMIHTAKQMGLGLQSAGQCLGDPWVPVQDAVNRTQTTKSSSSKILTLPSSMYWSILFIYAVYTH